MLGLGTTISKTGKLGVHDLGIVTSNLVLKHNYDLSSVQPLSDGAAVFDGDNDYIELGSQSGDLRLSGSNGSITAWIKPTMTGDTYQRIVDKSDDYSGTNGYALTMHDDGDIYCYIDGTNRIIASTALTAQKWHHITWTWDGTNHKLYIDGVLDVSNASSVTPPSDTTNMRIGTWNHTTAREYKGYMCNVGIFEEALTQAQIKSIMWKNYAGLTSSEKTDLVSWWNLDSVIPDTTTFVYDNYHGGGEVLGSELVVGDWLEQNGWTNITGGIRQDGTDGHTSISSEMTDFNGSVFKISYTLSNVTDPTNLKWKFGGGTLTTIGGTEGDHVYYLTSDATADNFQLSTNGNWAGDVTNISVKLVNGNTGTLS